MLTQTTDYTVVFQYEEKAQKKVDKEPKEEEQKVQKKDDKKRRRIKGSKKD